MIRICVVGYFPDFHGLMTLLNCHQIFVIMSVFPLPYNLGSPYFVHTLIISVTLYFD